MEVLFLLLSFLKMDTANSSKKITPCYNLWNNSLSQKLFINHSLFPECLSSLRENKICPLVEWNCMKFSCSHINLSDICEVYMYTVTWMFKFSGSNGERHQNYESIIPLIDSCFSWSISFSSAPPIRYRQLVIWFWQLFSFKEHRYTVSVASRSCVISKCQCRSLRHHMEDTRFYLQDAVWNKKAEHSGRAVWGINCLR
jgi:hypothetical protein